MLNRPSSPKIRPDHLDRLAVIYVRQSTLFQVRENTGSTTRQYDLVKRAQDLGAKVISPARDIPQGRMAIVTDPQGATFAVIQLSQ